MTEIHRMMVRQKLEEIYALFSAENPPTLFTKLLLDVANYLDEMRGKEEGELVDLYHARNRRFHKPVVKSMLAATGVEVEDKGRERDAKTVL